MFRNFFFFSRLLENQVLIFLTNNLSILDIIWLQTHTPILTVGISKHLPNPKKGMDLLSSTDWSVERSVQSEFSNLNLRLHTYYNWEWEIQYWTYPFLLRKQTGILRIICNKLEPNTYINCYFPIKWLRGTFCIKHPLNKEEINGHAHLKSDSESIPMNSKKSTSNDSWK